MFTMDVVALRQFYTSALGQKVAQHIASAVRRRWHRASSETVLGLGFTPPFLEQDSELSQGVFAMMPADLGALYWPMGERNRVAMVDMAHLPLQENTMHRAIVVHALEHAADASKVLEELWHVLIPGGRALLVVPQRRSFWAQDVHTPFGCGKPYSLMQLHALATDCGFTFVGHTTALYAPPVRWRWVLRLSRVIEVCGLAFFVGYGGVVVMEVEKQLYAGLTERVTEPSRLRFRLPVRAAAAATAPRNCSRTSSS